MITYNDDVVVIDWSTGNIGGGNTAINTMLNSLYYTSPEVACGQTVTRASDIYSLGKIFQHLVLGQLFLDKGGKITQKDLKGQSS